MPSDDPFFIVGSSRSGTTLLRLMINGHSRLHIPPETWFLLPLIAKLPLTDTLDAESVADAIAIITNHFRWGDMKMDALEFRREALLLEKPRLRDIMDLIYRRHLATVAKPRFGDKTPLYVGIVPQLAVIYPGARFIHLIRDGRDVAISFIDAGFEGRVYDGKRFEWINAVHKGLEYRQASVAEAILEVRYEDLVASPEQTLRKICHFIGEAFEEKMLSYADRVDMVPKRGEQIHTKLNKPLKDDAIGVWKTKLSGPACFVMEACLYRELQRLGYPLRFGSAIWRPFMAVLAWVLRGCAPFLDRLIPALRRRSLLPKRIYF